MKCIFYQQTFHHIRRLIAKFKKNTESIRANMKRISYQHREDNGLELNAYATNTKLKKARSLAIDESPDSKSML